MAAKKPPDKSQQNGKQPKKKHLGKAESTKPETEVEKLTRRGNEILQKFLENQLNQLELTEVRARILNERISLKDEIEKEVLNLKFFELLEPRDKISFWKALDKSVQTEAGLSQRLQAQGDVFQTFHNIKKMVDHLIFLEEEKEFKNLGLPYSPEFRQKVREEYAHRIMGITPDPANQSNEEEEHGGEEVDKISAGDPEPSD